MSCQCELSGVSVLHGNKVSHSQRKTRRKFAPNIHVVHFASDLTGQTYKFKVAAKTLRTVEKLGGFDQFIVKASDQLLSNKAKIVKRKVVSKKIKVSHES